MSAREITARGIIVARRSSGEGSVRVSVYTDALGLIAAVAKSAREERSKLRPHLQVGALGTFTFVKGRDVWRVTGAVDTKNVYFEVGGAKKTQETAARVIAAVRQFVRGEGNDPYLFSTLFDFFRSLPKISEERVIDAECLVMLRSLAALGYVREDPRMMDFLEIAYDDSMLQKTHASRTFLVRLINEGISASGL